MNTLLLIPRVAISLRWHYGCALPQKLTSSDEVEIETVETVKEARKEEEEMLASHHLLDTNYVVLRRRRMRPMTGTASDEC